MVAHVNTVSFQGIEIRSVDVQVQLSNGLPCFNIVGYVSAIITLLLFLTLFFVNSAFAMSCDIPYGREAIDKYPVILEGISTASGKVGQFNFEVTKVYKGDVNKGDIVTWRQGIDRRLLGGSNQADASSSAQPKLSIKFLNYDKDSKQYVSLGPCAPDILYESINRYPQNYYYRTKTMEFLHSYKTGDMKILEELIRKMPDVPKYLKERAEILVERGRYDEAISLYEHLVKQKFVTASKDKYRDKTEEEIIADYDQKYSGTVLGIADDIRLHRFAKTTGILPLYGRALYEAGNYIKAAKVLAVFVSGYRSNEEANQLYLRAQQKAKGVQ